MIVLGSVLLIVAAGMLFGARPATGADSVVWLRGPWIFGQAYILAVLVVGVVGVTLILTGWPT